MQSRTKGKRCMKKMVQMGMFLAYALILSYVESLIPFGFGIPGIKLGLPNLAIVVCLYYYGTVEALSLNLMRIMLSGFLFGNLYTIMYSIAGGMFSFFVMCILKRSRRFTVKGVSMAGGVFHNLGQLLIAAFVVATPGVFYYVPYLLIAGSLTGWLIGLSTKTVIPFLHKLEGKIL